MNSKKRLLYITLILVFIVSIISWNSPTGKLVVSYLIYQIYPSAFVTDIEITSGDYEGISIGSSKKEVMGRIYDVFEGKAQINESKILKGKTGVLVYLSEKNKKLLIEGASTWNIYFNDSFSDRLTIVFDNKNRVELIERYKQDIEFP